MREDTKKADGSGCALSLLLRQVFISAVTACAYPADPLAKQIGAVWVCVCAVVQNMFKNHLHRLFFPVQTVPFVGQEECLLNICF